MSPSCSLSNADNHPEILKILFMSLCFQSKYLIDLNAIPYWQEYICVFRLKYGATLPVEGWASGPGHKTSNR